MKKFVADVEEKKKQWLLNETEERRKIEVEAKEQLEQIHRKYKDLEK
jgi:hypothetical protein